MTRWDRCLFRCVRQLLLDQSNHEPKVEIIAAIKAPMGGERNASITSEADFPASWVGMDYIDRKDKASHLTKVSKTTHRKRYNRQPEWTNQEIDCEEAKHPTSSVSPEFTMYNY